MHLVETPDDEAERLSSLVAHAILDTGPDTYLDNLTRITARKLRMPIVMINIIASDRQWAKAAFGLPRGFEMSREHAFCSHTILAPGHATIIADALLDARVATNPFVTGKSGFRFYAGATILDAEGRALGAVCVLDIQPREFGRADTDVLLELAETVSARLEYYRAMAALRTAQHQIDVGSAGRSQMSWTASAEGEADETEGQWLSLVGLPDTTSSARGWIRAVHPDDLPMAMAAWTASVSEGQPLDLDYRLRLADGSYRWFRVRAAPQRDAVGEILRWYGTVEDIDDRKAADVVHRETATRLDIALDVGKLQTWELDLASRRLTASDVSVLNFGLQLGANISSHDEALIRSRPRHEKQYGREVQGQWDAGHELDIEYRSIWPDGSVRWIRMVGRPALDAAGKAVRLIGLSIDITAQRAVEEWQQAEAKTAYLAQPDTLTGLANRRMFHQELSDALSAATLETKVALLRIDLVDFKAVIDALGYDIGDTILQQVANRLKASVRSDDLVARYGVDEFAVLLKSVNRTMEIDNLAVRLLKSLEEPIHLGSQMLTLGGNIGISVAPEDTSTSVDLVRYANAALSRTKAGGRGHYHYFEPAMDERQQFLADLRLSMRGALDRGEFFLLYQPVVSVEDERVTSFEALIRWQHPERGLVSPADFIPLAEETGWIVEIGNWVLREACRQAVTWPESVSVAVNLSVAQFKGRNIEAEISAALAESGLAPLRLVLELTESILLQDDDAEYRAIRTLRQLGVRISMDDFGTGYSSLGYLRRFPFDTIKIDQSLVRDLPDHGAGDAIVAAIVTLARSLGLSVTAEGVETRAQFDLLRDQGCSHIQGYLFSRPVAASEVPDLLARRFPAAGEPTAIQA